MWKRFQALWPRTTLGRRLILAICVAGIGVGAFFCGRNLAPSHAAQVSGGEEGPYVQARPGTAEYVSRAVALIKDGKNEMYVTRADLGEYLIARFGAERVDFLVNRMIIDMACARRGIYVSDAEVEAQLKEDLRNFGNLTQKDFVNNLLKRYNKTLFEWKEDVIRPKLLMAKLCRDRLVVTEDELHKAFEAKYGQKVQCRMVFISKEQYHRRHEIWNKVSKSDDEFKSAARSSPFPAINANNGEVLIHRHFGDQRIEKEAFGLKQGDISGLLDMPDGTCMILKCLKHLEPDGTKKFVEERLALHREVMEMKLGQEIPQVFAHLRSEASPKIFMKNQITQEEMERAVQKEAPGIGAPPALPGKR